MQLNSAVLNLECSGTAMEEVKPVDTLFKGKVLARTVQLNSGSHNNESLLVPEPKTDPASCLFLIPLQVKS